MSRLETTDRARLCAAVSLLDVLQADGIEARRTGKTYIASLRPEDKTPSCHIYPPGVGQRGGDGWTFHDYGNGAGGDTLSYMVDIRGLPFSDALAELRRQAGETPEAADKRPKPPKPKPSQPPTPVEMKSDAMPHNAQADAVGLFLLELADLCPDAEADGKAYLADRGTLPEPWPVGIAYRLRKNACRTLADRLAQSPDAALLARAGLLKPGPPPRLPWWGETVLLPCLDADAAPVYLIGRRLDWTPTDRAGKYMNQPCPDDGPVRWPYGWPMIYKAAGRLDAWPWTPAKREVLIVEGPLDALGAAVLGWPGLALGMRPRARDYTDRHGAAPRMLEDHLTALRDLDAVHVVPDADGGDAGKEGEALACALVGWLRAAGCRAHLSLLHELFTATEGCKDVADVAQKQKGNP